MYYKYLLTLKKNTYWLLQNMVLGFVLFHGG